MQYTLSFLAVIAAVKGSPFPQGVTQNIAPEGGMPAGCMANRAGTFGIAVVAGTDMLAATQAADGQPAAATQIPDGMSSAVFTTQHISAWCTTVRSALNNTNRTAASKRNQSNQWWVQLEDFTSDYLANLCRRWPSRFPLGSSICIQLMVQRYKL